tara:strand:+ start:247 stop:1116 length:870 start_codon:yes stop_codon:yes gene_type:complete
MFQFVCINGQFVRYANAMIHVDDRGNLFADAVYEVMGVKNGTIIFFEDHMKRLRRSLAGLAINYEVQKDYINETVAKLLKKNKVQEGFVYLQISRGYAPRTHAFPAASTKPTVVMSLLEPQLLSHEAFSEGVHAITYPDLRWKRRDLKTVSLLPNVLAKQSASEQRAQEALLVEDDTIMTEGSSTNLFIINSEGELLTHPSDNNILCGITRSKVIELALKENMVVKEEVFTKHAMLQANEVFITSTTKRILPITTIDEFVIGDGKVGKVTSRLSKILNDFVAQYLEQKV